MGGLWPHWLLSGSQVVWRLLHIRCNSNSDIKPGFRHMANKLLFDACCLAKTAILDQYGLMKLVWSFEQMLSMSLPAGRQHQRMLRQTTCMPWCCIITSICVDQSFCC